MPSSCGSGWPGKKVNRSRRISPSFRRSRSERSPMIQKIHHIGIAVKSLDEALRFYSETLGLTVHKQAIVEQQGVKAALLTIGESEIELLEPLGPETPVGRFLERRGEGLHHLCFQTDGIDEELAGPKAKGGGLT